jgi:cell division protein FtsL
LGAPFARVARARGSSFLDALLRGRVWIGLVGLLLVGIVFFNVDLLRLNREIAHTTEKSTALKRENGRLLLDVARLDSSERLQEAAARRGFILPAPNDVRYLRARPRRDARDAARRMTAADAEGGALAGVVPTPPAPTQPQGAAGQPPGAAAQPQASPAQPPGTGTGQPSGAGQAQSAGPGATQPQTPAATQPQVTQPGLGAGGPAG